MFAESDLSLHPWHFSITGKARTTRVLSLTEDGQITGQNTDNECFWHFDKKNRLCFSDKERQLSAVLAGPLHVLRKILFSGTSLDGKTPYTLENIIPGMDADTPWTYLALKKQIADYGWNIGEYSYGKPKLHAHHMGRLTIGRYSSIGPDVDVVLGNHRTDTFTTYPFKVLGRLWSGVPDVDDHESRGDVIIGSDVWIGTGALISSGVQIGHGAVIGARSVVTHNVPPYAVVAGVPAKIIRYRFDEPTVARLLDIAWWDWDYEKVNANLWWIMRGDIAGYEASNCMQ